MRRFAKSWVKTTHALAKVVANDSQNGHLSYMTKFHAEATAPTPNAARHAEQLFKHLRHKSDASSYAEGTAKFDFQGATANLRSTPEGLVISCAAVDLAGLGRAKQVIEIHLLRFALREELKPLTWSGPETPAPPARPPQPT